jgi:hypothetical protein
MFDTIKQVTICGGGNASHVVVPLLKDYGVSVTLYTPFAEEAAFFSAGLSSGGISLIEAGHSPVTGAADLITTDPREAARADLVLLVLPAFAHGPTLGTLSPYLAEEAVIGAIPARSGFELQADFYLNLKSSKRTIFCGQTLPWACRIIEQGQKVKVLGAKEQVGLATVPSTAAVELSAWLSRALKVKFVPMKGSLAVSLGNIGQVIHPGIMYGLLKNYNGAVWSAKEIPLFYQGVTEEIATLLETLSAEIVQTAQLLTQKYGIDLNEVITVRQWLTDSYSASIEDKSTLARAFCTNRSYRGLKVLVVEVENGYKPDFKSRYLTEDIPYGLLYSKAVAAMIDFPTPHMDQVIKMAGKWAGKSYLNSNSLLSGPDIIEARIPQNYGINDPLALVQISQGLK